jgi:mevalonate kinase
MDFDAYSKMLNQIASLIQMIYDNSDKPISKKEEESLNAQVEALEKKMEELKTISRTFIKKSHTSDYTIETMLEDEKTESISPEIRKILKKAENLKSEVKLATQDLSKAASAAKAAGKPLLELNENDKKIKSRKGKFRSIGGVKDWKAL